MPCRREEEEDAGEEAEGEEEEGSFLLLEQSVTLGGSGEVDRLVAQIGETLQLDAARDSPASPRAPPGPPLQPPRPAAVSLRLPPASAEAGSPAPPGAVRCGLGDRGRGRGRAALPPASQLQAEQRTQRREIAAEPREAARAEPRPGPERPPRPRRGPRSRRRRQAGVARLCAGKVSPAAAGGVGGVRTPRKEGHPRVAPKEPRRRSRGAACLG
ncbi:PREDICTED: GSK-3-binding protein FRAT2 [Chinchilla lanigera]|uniref:GSK-3-binding protein FRAT2 n=1 Tax=Chinchilla lanigera TaxID=34839 RepID=UPI000695BFFD|nr:PREDICTED: GSK-3-binding protein FRAT2 [Chinchilla lanigera]